MAKKAELLNQAKKLKLDVSEKNTIAEIEAALNTAGIEVTEEKSAASKATAKAGKRSTKAISEKEAEQAKEERKATHKTEEVAEAAKPKQHKNPTRSRIERQSKKMREAAKLIDSTKLYSLKEALELSTKTSTVKFDATVEVHMNLGVDPRHADQNIRDSLVLPAGLGKKVRVAVFADVDDAAKAKKAGADIAGIEDITAKLDKGIIEFDVLVATPTQMAKLGKYARTLGPKGLMPNPKSGTVTADVEKAVNEAKAGRVEYRVDSTGIVHVGIGKVSFGGAKLLENAQALIASIKSNKPSSIKGTYIQSTHITTTMGPSIKLDIANL